MENSAENYINNSRQSGQTDQQIKQTLLASGRNESQLIQFFPSENPISNQTTNPVTTSPATDTAQNDPKPSPAVISQTPVKKTKHLLYISVAILILALVVSGVTGFYYKSQQQKKSTVITTPLSPITTIQDSAFATNAKINLQATSCHNMSVISARANGPITVGSSGDVTGLLVSNNGAQIVFVTNSSSTTTLCLSAISVPGEKLLTFDADSTAKASIFMTVGILTTDPTEANSRLSMVSSLNSYPSFLKFMQSNLLSIPYSSVVKDATYGNLLESCVTELGQKLGKPN